MRKSIIAALFLLLSVSAFAQNVNVNTVVGPDYQVEDVDVNGLSIILGLALPKGSKIGNCTVKLSNVYGNPLMNSVKAFRLQIEGSNKNVDITLTSDGTLSTKENENHGDLILDAGNKTVKAGILTTQVIRVVSTATRNSEYVTDLVIETKRDNGNGVMRVIKDKSIRCTRR